MHSVTVCPANVSAKVVEAPVYAYRETECCCTLLDCVSDFVYSSSMGSFLSAELNGKLDALLRRLKRFGYIRDNLRFLELLDKTDQDLFKCVGHSTGCTVTSSSLCR